MKVEFERHEAKARANEKAHGIGFDLAKSVFKDPFGIERLDDRKNYGEERFVVIGMAENHILAVIVYTEREGRIRIISARRATQHEQYDYYRQNT
jgi:hypothetical protein